MPQLEDVDRADARGLGSARDLLALRIAREKRREAAPAIGVREAQHHGVLVLAPVARPVRPDRPELEPPDAQGVSPADLATAASRQQPGGIAQLARYVGRRALPHEHGAHRDATHQRLEATVVVVVQVRDHHRVEPPHVEPGELPGTGVVRGTGVHQDGGPAVLHQDGVPLPDVEDAQARALEHTGAEGEDERDAEREREQ